MHLLLLVTVPILLLTSFKNNDLKGVEVLQKMIESIDHISTIQFKLKDHERINNKIRIGEEDVKMTYDPLQIYVYVQQPDKGVEVLWKKGENHNKAYVHSKGIPFTLSLDPYGKKMRNGHHTLFELNFHYIQDIVKEMKRNSGNQFERYIKNVGKIDFDGKHCYQIEIHYPEFRYYSYQVKNGESIIDIAKDKNLSEYMILEKNHLKNYHDIKEGQQIKLPTAYAAKTIFYIDEATYLPLVQMIYDDQGLFEKYEYYDLKLNPTFDKNEFSKKNKSYHF
jgi:LysM repeat protein